MDSQGNLERGSLFWEGRRPLVNDRGGSNQDPGGQPPNDELVIPGLIVEVVDEVLAAHETVLFPSPVLVLHRAAKINHLTAEKSPAPGDGLERSKDRREAPSETSPMARRISSPPL